MGGAAGLSPLGLPAWLCCSLDWDRFGPGRGQSGGVTEGGTASMVQPVVQKVYRVPSLLSAIV
jgi:hypothetical protein